ncbi:hypothetical protein Fmac_028305 [Flemingia macrophylla]|uniref:Uncharacterized protein n=1 Tax=Flemingia macrophylla TaxID=520843 RepID=A0ABD1L759_9FABA
MSGKSVKDYYGSLLGSPQKTLVSMTSLPRTPLSTNIRRPSFRPTYIEAIKSETNLKLVCTTQPKSESDGIREPQRNKIEWDATWDVVGKSFRGGKQQWRSNEGLAMRTIVSSDDGNSDRIGYWATSPGSASPPFEHTTSGPPILFNHCHSLSLWTNMCNFTTNVGVGPSHVNAHSIFSDTGWVHITLQQTNLSTNPR